MRIATFNINNIVKRLPNLLAWLHEDRPDVVCLQELKCEDGAFPQGALEAAGYGAVWRGQRSWNGVAILARDAVPILTRRALPGDPADDQARYIEAAVQGVLISSIYLPNGNPQPGPKFAYKLAWFERLSAHANSLLAAGVPAILAGDFNVVPTEADIWPGHREQANALLQPEVRSAYARLLQQGWTDALRTAQPDGPLPTFWGYLRHRWRDDKGMRLDHLLLSPSLAPKLIGSGVARWTRAEEGASDHAPAWIELDHGPIGGQARQPPRAASRRRQGGSNAVGRSRASVTIMKTVQAEPKGDPHSYQRQRRTSMPAKSAAQQKAAGAALSAKRGDTSKSKLKGASKHMAESMSEKQLEEFAHTKRKGKPEHAAK